MLMWLIIFFSVFALNLAPAFAPPTWMVLSYLAVMFHPLGWLLAILGALAATSGRLVLAKLSQVVIRNRLLSAKTRANIDVLKQRLEHHKQLTFSIFLFYAFGPFPSNQLFMAYGLTGLPVRYVAWPFFLGRLVSYTFWIYTASAVTHKLAASAFAAHTFFGAYFVLSQILTLVVVYLFAELDWQKLFKKKGVGLIKDEGKD